MENSKEQYPKKDSEKVVVHPLVVPKEKPVQKSKESEIMVPERIEILKPSEEGENWNEKLPKQGYDPEYPNMPTSGGTLL